MALDRHQNFVSSQYLEYKWIEFHLNEVNAFIFIRSRLGLLHPIFCLFVAELKLLSDVRTLFLLNMFRTWHFTA